MFTTRYQGGEEIYEILQRISALEQGGASPDAVLRRLDVTHNFTLIYDIATQPNTILFSEPDGRIMKRSLASLIHGVNDQTHISSQPDGTLLIQLPQNIATTSDPTF